MLYNYKAINPDGARVEGKIDGANEDDAIGILQDRGLIIVSLDKYEDKNIFGSPDTGFKIPFLGPRITGKDIVVFSRQISTLFESGVSALRSFRLVATETENIELKKILNSIGDDIQSGVSISSAMGKYDKVFGTFYSNMVKAGEESGKLNQSFNYLADYLDRNFDLTQKIKKASIYPAFVTSTFFVVMGIMVTFVIPQLAAMLSDEGGQLPLVTRIILGFGNLMQSYGIFILLFIIFLIYYLNFISKTESGKQYIDHFKLNIPVFKVLYKKVFISRLADNLDTMLSSGVPVVRSLEITGDVVDNGVYKDILARIAIKVKNGKSLSQAFYEEEEIPNIVVQMTKIGEETGKLGFVLKSLSSYYKREVETSIDTVMSLIEPTLIILLAGGVGVLLAAVLIPMYSVVTNI
jgi:type IV pilus assembly protein PilC